MEAYSVGATVSVLNVVTLGPAPRTYLLKFKHPHPSICDSEVRMLRFVSQVNSYLQGGRNLPPPYPLLRGAHLVRDAPLYRVPGVRSSCAVAIAFWTRHSKVANFLGGRVVLTFAPEFKSYFCHFQLGPWTSSLAPPY